MAPVGTATAEAPRALRRRMRLGIVVGCTLGVLIIFAIAYVRVGWSRMESACTDDSPRGPGATSVAFSWSWTPPGFACTYADGRIETALWF